MQEIYIYIYRREFEILAFLQSNEQTVGRVSKTVLLWLSLFEPTDKAKKRILVKVLSALFSLREKEEHFWFSFPAFTIQKHARSILPGAFHASYGTPLVLGLGATVACIDVLIVKPSNLVLPNCVQWKLWRCHEHLPVGGVFRTSPHEFGRSLSPVADTLESSLGQLH